MLISARKLIDLLETHAEVEFNSLRSKLGLKKPKGSDTDYTFNLEAGGEKRLKGNTTRRAGCGGYWATITIS